MASDETPGAITLVIAEMVTHDYIWRGAGATRAQAREALLAAWTLHRAHVVSHHPALAGRLPVADCMEQHFAIRYSSFSPGAGYRDAERLV